jgi:cholesterol oxidase
VHDRLPPRPKNTLVKNYLYLAERRGVEILPERTVTDIRPLRAADGSDGYAVTHERSGSWLARDRQRLS